MGGQWQTIMKSMGRETWTVEEEVRKIGYIWQVGVCWRVGQGRGRMNIRRENKGRFGFECKVAQKTSKTHSGCRMVAWWNAIHGKHGTEMNKTWNN